MKRQSLIPAILSAAMTLTFAACQREAVVDASAQDRPLSFVPSMSSQDGNTGNPASKSMTIQSSDGSISLPLEYSVCDGMPGTLIAGTDSEAAGSAVTKAAQYNTVTDLQTIGSFKVTAWNSNHTKFIPTDESSEGTVRFAAGRWTLDGTAPLWTNADVKTFFAYTNIPEGSAVTCTTDESQTFSYTQVKQNAADQLDALLGYYNGNGDRDDDGTPDGVAKIRFIHPLTAVVFKQGTFEGISQIKKLLIDGVHDGGTATVTYSYAGDGTLVPNIVWNTSASGTMQVMQEFPGGIMPGDGKPLGVPFIIIPQNLAEHKVTLKAVVTTNGGDQTVQAELNTGSWVAGKTNTYTIGYDGHTYSYTFELADEAQANQTFKNTTTSQTKTISITNQRTDEGGEVSSGEYIIKSVKVGTDAAQTINDVSFKDIAGLSAMASAGSLSLTALERASVNPGMHDYWLNQNPVREDNLDWSPDEWTSQGTIDLSKYDFSEDDPSKAINAHPMTTANCYIIRHAGTYKLPLVYGNAIVNGAFNEQSYYPNCNHDVTDGDDATKNYRLVRFQNHIQHDDLSEHPELGIISPFIEYNTTDGKAKDETNSYLAPATGSDGYQIVWQDQADIITIGGISEEPVTVKNADGTDEHFDVSYITFTIPLNKICQNNAIIAVKDAGGNIMWSWHIWTTNDPALLNGPIAVTNITNEEYKFLPLSNLGWLDADRYPSRPHVKIVLQQKKSGEEIEITVSQPVVSTAGRGCWYQFGRKDPMCTVDSPKQGSFTPNGGNNDGNGVSLATAISNPDKFYIEIGGDPFNYDWCTDTYYNLWSGKKSAAGQFDQDENPDIIKTIYDPSPAGYKLPASKAYTGFTTTGGNTSSSVQFNVEGEFAYGWTFYTKPGGKAGDGTVFFPAAGYRNRSDGSVYSYSVGSGGRYWSAVPNSVGSGYLLYFDSGYVYPLNGYNRASGFSLRPVQE